MSYRSILSAALCASLVACAGTNFSFSNARNVHEGMTGDEVSHILGKPYMVTTLGDKEVWTWSYANGITGSSRNLAIPFRDGRVLGVPNIPADFK
jgi:outer membrane protein assembly factor BamE (lipoprotein component of BamABCDE complex)